MRPDLEPVNSVRPHWPLAALLSELSLDVTASAVIERHLEKLPDEILYYIHHKGNANIPSVLSASYKKV